MKCIMYDHDKSQKTEMANDDRLTRRSVLGIVGGISFVAFAGCNSGSERVAAGDATETETEGYGSNANSNALGFEIDYVGEWQGSITADGQQQSIDGYGMRNGNITPAPDYASITAQKEEETGELAVRFFYEGEVVREGSTTADYGVVTVSVSA